MKKLFSSSILLLTTCFLMVSCQRTSSQTWENMKTAGNYFNRGLDAMIGNNNDSKLFNESGEFIGPSDGDFIALNDKDLKAQFSVSDASVPQPKDPGQKGSPVSGIGDFRKPQGELASLLQNLHFGTDDHVLRTREELVQLQRIATYLKKNPNVFLSVEGHCDERASAAYNMSLGARRANHVRVLLIKNGIDFNRIYTISHGKEKPVSLGHITNDWKQNRRAEFKVYAK